MASRSLNKAMLIGNVGREPRLKHTPGGIPVVTFRLATTETWKERNGAIREHTDWHTVVAWRGLAQTTNKVIQKGDKVYVEGKIQTRIFDDKTGIRKTVVEILADNVLLIGRNRNKREESEVEVVVEAEEDVIIDNEYEIDYNLDDYINDYSTDEDDVKPNVPF
jgi:single stranded DNA-binding protein